MNFLKDITREDEMNDIITKFMSEQIFHGTEAIDSLLDSNDKRVCRINGLVDNAKRVWVLYFSPGLARFMEKGKLKVKSYKWQDNEHNKIELLVSRDDSLELHKINLIEKETDLSFDYKKSFEVS